MQSLTRTANKEAVDACKSCVNRGRPCWKEEDKKREQGLALRQEVENMLPTRKSNNKPVSLEITALEASAVANKESN
jgi:hypothetical protein